jgi:predicted RNA binding protein YcfA (HicA-like mRNA interferase family)
MKPLKINEAIKLLESHGFTMLRSNGHMVFGLRTIRVALSHGRICSPGIMREITKAIKQAESQEVKCA